MSATATTRHTAESGPDDRELLARLVSRDADALGELYDRHSRLLFGLIRRILGDRAESEDVLQEVFLQAWNRATSYEPALGSPVAWLVGIARHRAIDRLRALDSRQRTAESAPPPAAAPSPEWHAATGERQRAVARALDDLPPDQRMLIEEAYFSGFSQSELAERHALPLGTVKTRIRAGMTRLRDHLQRTQAPA